MKRLLAALCFTLGVSACTSVQQPIAQVPLVSASSSNTQAIASSSLQSLLNTGTAGQIVQYQQTSFTLSAQFFSARGEFCRFMSTANSRNLYCKNETGQWFPVPAVLSNVALSNTGATK